MENRQNLAYILPNLFTAGSIFLAIIAVIAAFKGNYEKAFWLIVLSAVFDALDGRVARVTKTTSKFGKEFDSLADIVAFGVAPAFFLYFAAGIDFGRFGVLVTGLYIIFGAVRLARFNVISDTTEPNVFIGLPIPAAALFVISAIMVYIKEEFISAPVLLVSVLLVSILMVSNIRYPSFKKMDMKKSNYTRSLVMLMFLLAIFYLYPTLLLPIVAVIYVLIGPIRVILNYKKLKRTTNEQNDKNI